MIFALENKKLAFTLKTGSISVTFTDRAKLTLVWENLSYIAEKVEVCHLMTFDLENGEWMLSSVTVTDRAKTDSFFRLLSLILKGYIAKKSKQVTY